MEEKRKKIDFNNLEVLSMRGDVNSFHLEWLDEKYAEKNKNEEKDWTKHKMIPVLTWADKETCDADTSLWLSREGLYHITFDKWVSGVKPINFNYGKGFKTANEAIEYYSIG